MCASSVNLRDSGENFDIYGLLDIFRLKINDKLKLVPGHCDPTCNVHDWYVGVRAGKVEVVWPVSARGKAY